MQGTLEKAIANVTGEQVTVAGSGRTDAGAHAVHQVVAFSTGSTLPVDTLGRAMNANLPADVAVTHVHDVDDGFHPRIDASSRTYRYLIWNRSVRSPFWLGRAAHVERRLDEHLMHRAAQHLVGTTDLSSFVPVAQAGSRERCIHRAECARMGDLVVVELEASGFMRQMVRSIVGTLVRVGRGAVSIEHFQEIISARDRKLGGDTVPAEGLYLVNVNYTQPGHQAARIEEFPWRVVGGCIASEETE